jgi:hypothetical protein
LPSKDAGEGITHTRKAAKYTVATRVQIVDEAERVHSLAECENAINRLMMNRDKYQVVDEAERKGAFTGRVRKCNQPSRDEPREIELFLDGGKVYNEERAWQSSPSITSI